VAESDPVESSAGFEGGTEAAFATLLRGDPPEAFAALREAGVCPVTRDDGTPWWVVSRYEEVRAALADPRLSLDRRTSRQRFTGLGLPPVLDRNLLNMDDPDHARIRRLAGAAFTPRRVGQLRGRIQAHTDRLLDELASPRRRFSLVDLEFGEREVPVGDMTLACLAAADFDPSRFTDPHLLDLSRDPNPHLSFGHGPHYCLGAPLAKLEARIALWTLFHRYPDLALAVPASQLRWKDDYRQRSLLELPVHLRA
jgi:cytochrome P450